MRLIAFLFVILGSFCANAQTVSKIQGSEAVVDLSGREKFQVGERVHFLTDNLDTSGEGEITKISAGGNKAIIKILAGKVSVGMSLEKKTAQVAEKKVNTEKLSYADLSESDRRIWQIGYISDGRYIVGGILGTWPLGFGIGHAIQGRYADKGWIFTVGELGSLAVAAAGLGNCVDEWSNDKKCSAGLFFLGAMGYVGFRIWEIIDVWATPPWHNRRYRQIESAMSEGQVTFEPSLIPLADGGMLGLRVTF